MKRSHYWSPSQIPNPEAVTLNEPSGNPVAERVIPPLVVAPDRRSFKSAPAFPESKSNVTCAEAAERMSAKPVSRPKFFNFKIIASQAGEIVKEDKNLHTLRPHRKIIAITLASRPDDAQLFDS